MDGAYGELFGAHHGFHWGLLVVLAVIVALVVITVLVLRSLERSRQAGGSTTRQQRPADQPSGAEEILRSRLANGEIDVTEFRERMAALVETSWALPSGRVRTRTPSSVRRHDGGRGDDGDEHAPQEGLAPGHLRRVVSP